MYIRVAKTTPNPKTGAIYVTHQLVESHRTEKGPRQRIIMHLEALELPRMRWRELSVALEAAVTGQPLPCSIAADIQAVAATYMAQHGVKDALRHAEVQRKSPLVNHELVPVDLESLSNSLVRSLGCELVGHAFYQRLGFPELMASCGLDAYQRDLAEAVILGRLIAPHSDLGTWHWLRAQTSLPEFLASDLEQAGKDAVYEIADRLWVHHKVLEAGLREREGKLFPRGETIILYDLTNSHFEGRCLHNDLAKRGHSKQKRTDCPLVTLALVVDARGFPLFSQIYEGNQPEPMTLLQVIKRLEEDGGVLFEGVKPTLVMDRGIATKENLALIRAEHYPYLVIERRDEAKAFEPEFLKAPAGFEEVKERSDKERVWIKKLPAVEGVDGEPALARVLCFSEGRAEKEHGIDRLKEERFLLDLEKMNKSIVTGYIKDTAKANQRIGRLLERYAATASQYQITLVLAEDPSKAVGVTWCRTDKVKSRDALQGCYVIQTTHVAYDADRIWGLYMTLTRVEAAFRALKSDLGLRPIWHQGDDRTRAHLFVSVLAYHILASVERTLRQKGDHRSWATLREELDTHKRSTISMRGAMDTVHQIRLSSTPEKVHQEIYRLLEVGDPLAKRRRDLNVRV
jgi:transposase